MLRLIGFDVGEKRVGVAVSDALGVTAQGVETFSRTGDLEKDVSYLLALAGRYRPAKLVFGMPRNMDGSYGMQAEKTRAFAEAVLAGWDGEFAYWDERLTTASARRVLLEADMRRDKRKKVVDQLAATLILQSYLDANGVR